MSVSEFRKMIDLMLENEAGELEALLKNLPELTSEEKASFAAKEGPDFIRRLLSGEIVIARNEEELR